MDYFKHYENLIERARNRGTKKNLLSFYTEKHRGFPGCMGGKYWKHNIFLLTPEEHYVAHQLLVKMFPDETNLIYALSQMTQGRPSNKRYGWVKRRYQSVCKQRIGESNGSYGRSWYHDPETLENGKFLPEDIPEGWVKGRVPVKRNSICKNCGKITDTKTGHWCSDCRYKPKRNTIIIPKKNSSLKRVIKTIFEINHEPTWDDYYKLKNLMLNHLFNENMSPREIKEKYNLSYSDFGMFLKKSLNITLKNMPKGQ